MKERGMIFNAEMVRAILDGRKVQTRRPVKGIESGDAGIYGLDDNTKCPFGVVGDRIWVRETFRIWENGSYEYPNEGVDVYRGKPSDAPEWGFGKHSCEYLASSGRYKNMSEYPCIPSIHMPRWASRITLEITDVRVEQVQDISEEDAIAEGCLPADPATGKHTYLDPSAGSYRLHFQSIWNSIYSNWDNNPWAWVVEFKVI